MNPTNPGDERLIELVHEYAAAMGAGDDAALAQMTHDRVEVKIQEDPEGGVWGGDFDPLYTGKDAAMAALRAWHEAWAELTLAIDTVKPLGEGKLLVLGRWLATGRASGAPVEIRYPAIHSYEGESLIRIEYLAEEEADRLAAG